MIKYKKASCTVRENSETHRRILVALIHNNNITSKSIYMQANLIRVHNEMRDFRNSLVPDEWDDSSRIHF